MALSQGDNESDVEKALLNSSEYNASMSNSSYNANNQRLSKNMAENRHLFEESKGDQI